MDFNFERKMCDLYFNKNIRDRIYYELTSKKKRQQAINRFAHNSSELLSKQNIYLASTKLITIKEIHDFLLCDKCYCICMNSEIDGEIVNIDQSLKALYSVGPYFLFNLNNYKCFLETEYNFTEHYSYLLMSKSSYL